MKQEIWKSSITGALFSHKWNDDDVLLGTIDIEPVKKVVTKDSVIIPITSVVYVAGKQTILQVLPDNAIHPRIVYDIEEVTP